jgi:MFS family permease
MDWMLPLLVLERSGPVSVGVIYALANIDDVIMAFVAGPYADRYGRKPLIVMGSAVYVMGCLMLVASMASDGVLSTVLLWLAVILLYGVTGISVGPRLALVAESVKPDYLGKAFSTLALAGRVARAGGSLVLGLLFTTNRNSAFVVMFVCALIGLLLHLLLRETRAPDTGSPAVALRLNVNAFIRTIRSACSPTVAPLFLIIALTGLGQATTGNYYSPYLCNELSLDEARIGALYSLMMCLQALSLPIAGWFVDKRGFRSALLVSNALGGGLLLLFAFSRSTPLVVAAMLGSASVATFEGVGKQVAMSSLTDPSVRATTFGASESLFNLMFVVGPLLGGLLYSRGSPLPFVLGALLLLFAVIPVTRLEHSSCTTERGTARGGRITSTDGGC